MADEPDLHPYQSGPWVTYLQQTMKYLGLWDGPEDGDFGADLLAAVRAAQTTYQLDPADGVVRANVWAFLTDPGHDPRPSGPALHDTGAQATEVPQSMQVGGLPAFRYALPSIPLAEATFDTGAATVHLKLSLTGGVTVTFEKSPAGVSTSVNDQTWRLAATHSLHGLTEGIQIQGIGGGTPSISATLGTEFEQTEVRFTPPDTMSFLGRCLVDYQVHTDVGPATMQGSTGYQLDVTVEPHPAPEPVPEPVTEDDWVQHYAPALVAVGVATLIVVVAVAAAPETGGGSLALILEAEELGMAAAAF